MSFSVKFTDNSAAVLRALQSATHNGLTEIGKSAVSHARERVPVDTGALRDSIEATVEGDTLTVGSSKEYALPVETGTYKMAARPYLKPAMTEYGDEYERTMRDALENA